MRTDELSDRLRKIWLDTSFTRNRSIFSLCSHQTDERGWISTFFQSVVLLSAHAQSVTLADPQWRNLDPSASTRSHARYAARSPAVVRTWMDQSETLLSSFAETPPETILLQGFPELFIPGRHAQESSGVEIAKWRIHATTPLPHKDLDDNGVYSAPVKFSTVPALISSLALGFWTTKRKYFHTLSGVPRVQKT